MERLSVNDSFSEMNLSKLVPASDQIGPITSWEKAATWKGSQPCQLTRGARTVFKTPFPCFCV
jgi:hypothetical protein